MHSPKTTTLFEDGGDQCVQLPEGFEFAGEEVQIWMEGDKVVLAPLVADEPK